MAWPEPPGAGLPGVVEPYDEAVTTRRWGSGAFAGMRFQVFATSLVNAGFRPIGTTLTRFHTSRNWVIVAMRCLFHRKCRSSISAVP